MLDPETIATCCRLLGLYDGVTVEHSRGLPSGYACFILRITDPASVARLAYCASDACVDFSVWPVGHAWPLREGETIDPDWASPNRIRYQLRAEPDAGSGEPESKVVVLCVCMVDQLVGLGRVDGDERDRMRAGWGY
jgi:hypothetical protein